MYGKKEWGDSDEIILVARVIIWCVTHNAITKPPRTSRGKCVFWPHNFPVIAGTWSRSSATPQCYYMHVADCLETSETRRLSSATAFCVHITRHRRKSPVMTCQKVPLLPLFSFRFWWVCDRNKTTADQRTAPCQYFQQAIPLVPPTKLYDGRSGWIAKHHVCSPRWF